jgi:hypothetical protein
VWPFEDVVIGTMLNITKTCVCAYIFFDMPNNDQEAAQEDWRY